MNILIKLAALAVPVSLAIAPLTAIAQTETQTDTQTTKVVAYRCTGGKAFNVRYGQNNAVVVLDEQTINLLQTRSADGTRFADETETYVLFSKGNEVILQKNGKAVFEKCTVVQAASATESESGSRTTTVTRTTTTTVQRKPAATHSAPASQGVPALW